MKNEIRRITSERGGDLLVVNGHKFRYIRQRADGYVRWRCCKRQCTSTVLMTTDDSVIENASEHNHPVDPIQKLDRQVLRESCKRKATSSITTQPIKLIRSELMNSTFFHCPK
uniref:FLYWCH-type domain-containing protein n=1 Tax=Schizaphis graminum TaxID=13262 RepID=A0A2S2PPE8_SCHGA